MSRGAIIGLILLVGLVLLIVANMEACRSGSSPAEEGLELQEGAGATVSERKVYRIDLKTGWESIDERQAATAQDDPVRIVL